jgi:lysophospholipase L1-like esterase
MKRIACSSLFFLVLTLSACGGGGSGSPTEPNALSTSGSTGQSSSPPPSNTTPPPSSNTPPTLSSVAQVVGYYGDSTIRGYQSGTGAQVSKSAPQAFAEALPSSPPQQVLNFGVDGQTACQLLRDTDWTATMASSNATVIILNHGINDAATGVPLRDYRSCLTGLANTARSAGKRVIFETPNPIDSGGLENYVSAMKDVAAQEGLPVIDQYENLVQSGRPIREIVPDGTHPSDAVYIEKGRFAANTYMRIPL